MEAYWSETKDELIKRLRTNEHHGLSPHEVRLRLGRLGANVLSEAKPPSILLIFLRQWRSPLVLILLAAAIISAVRADWTDVVVIAVVIVGNSIIGTHQEYRANRTLSALKHVLAPQARVIRQSNEEKIPAKWLVEGDIIILEAGDRVPADARIIEAGDLRVNESALTGESLPSTKRSTTVRLETTLADRHNMLYSSTLVVSGRAVAVVVATGNRTELGRIAKEVIRLKTEPTHLEKNVAKLGRWLILMALIISLLALLLGLARGVPVYQMLAITLSLLVSIVPEGLHIALTVCLSVGLMRMFRRHVVIRQLSAIETLGSLTTLCIDKTGTITEGELMVEQIITADSVVEVTGRGFGLTGSFSQEQQMIDPVKHPAVKTLLELCSLATMSTISRADLKNDQARSLTDPTETALAVVAAKAGFYAFEEEKRFPEILEMPFNHALGYSSSTHQLGAISRMVIKGSPEKILAQSSYYLNPQGRPVRCQKQTLANFEVAANQAASRGYRVVAIAYNDLPKGVLTSNDLPKNSQPSSGHGHNLTLVGFLCMTDPIRPDVGQAISLAHQAGLRIIMITGDHLLTATAVAKRLGLDEGRIIHATDLSGADLKRVSVIARATPLDKLELIERLRRSGEIVGMTGDGINDAPALKKADIGIAPGARSSEVAIEASAMVLLDNQLSAIVSAIKEGRVIWENLKKVIFYLVSTSLGESLTILGALALGLPLPLVAVQILWMNLVTDGVMTLSLAVEGGEEGLMAKSPRQPKTGLINRFLISRSLIIGLTMMVGSLFVFHLFVGINLAYAQTAVLTTLVLFQIFNIFNSRSTSQSAFSSSTKNPTVTGTFLIACLLQLLAVYSPFGHRYLHTVSLDLSTILVCVGVALSVILVEELRKLSVGLTLDWAKLQRNLAESG